MGNSNGKYRPNLKKASRIGQHKSLDEIFPEMAAGAEFPNEPLGRIKLIFADTFLPWEITLPDEAVAQRIQGKICKAGWAIWFLFGSNDIGEYLDYYSSHRMTNDGHVRVYFDGQIECLDSIPEFRSSSDDPVKDAQLELKYREECRKITEMLEAKGFGMTGDEPGGVQIRRYQQLMDPE